MISLFGRDQFDKLLDESPEALLNACGVAVCEIHYESVQLSSSIIKLNVRLQGHKVIQPFKELKAFQIGKFITIQGNVLRVSAVRPFPTQVAFICARCLQSTVVHFKDGIFKNPTKCQTNHCNSKKLSLDRESQLTQCINIQRIRLQEIMDPTNIDEEGRIPRLIEAELTNDLVDSVVPGEMIYLSGILKTLENNDKFNQTTPTAFLYLDIVAIQKSKSVSSLIDLPFSRQQEINSLAQSKTLLASLIYSFCPHIYGNEMVKLGLLLGLLGGSKRMGSSSIDKETISIRSDPHLLIVGDPGLGKSQLLRFASTVAPRAVYVCANTSTAVGLTASVQEGGLEAGALVLADQGCCCIDEFDKIGSDGWRSLLDVMEQQTVNVAKAGVVCTLPARTTILAAANPISGHYNKAKSVVENLKMDAALLSRFDLIFVLLDKPNADMDKVLSEHVLGNVVNGNQFKNTSSPFISQPDTSLTTLHNRIVLSKETSSLIDETLLRCYISYARQKINPKMTEEAASIVQGFYMEMRQSHISDETLPITTRHLESMIRLAEARAKLELRTFVTAADASDIVELMKFCTADTISIEHKLLNSGPKPPRKGSKTAAIKTFVSELIKISSRTGEIDFTQLQLQSLYNSLSIPEFPFRELIDALNENGYLLCRSTGFRLLVT